MSQVVKRKGHKEPFEPRKIYASVYAACTSLRMTDEEAELIAQKVVSNVKDTLKDTHEIDAHTIHKKVVDSLRIYHPEAAYLYDNHRDIS